MFKNIVINKLTVVSIEWKKGWLANFKYTLTTNQNDEAAQIDTVCIIINTWSRIHKASYFVGVYVCV